MKVNPGWLWFLLLGLGLYSCGPKIVFSKTMKIESQAWNYDHPIGFSFTPPDSTQVYNLLLDIEHSTDFEYQNTYVKINTTFPSGQKDEQSLSLNLADKKGRWKGNCRGEVCTATIGLQMNTYFKELGNYQIQIVQDSRENPLPGINAFTLKLESVEKSR